MCPDDTRPQVAHDRQGAIVRHVPPVLGVSSTGLFASRLWARHISDKFRDAVAVAPPSHAPLFPDPDREVTRDFHRGNSRAHRARRGARLGA